MFKSIKKPGLINSELTISLVLILAVLLTIILLFSNNLKILFVRPHINNVKAQADIQIKKEEGIKRLRQEVNNIVIPIIQDAFEEPDSSTVPLKTVNTISYLTQIINVASGSPDICVRMKKPSDAKCGDQNIGGYRYEIRFVKNNRLAITKVELSGDDISTRLFNGSEIPEMKIAKYSKTRDKYKKLKVISMSYGKYIDINYSLLRIMDKFNRELYQDAIKSVQSED